MSKAIVLKSSGILRDVLDENTEHILDSWKDSHRSVIDNRNKDNSILENITAETSQSILDSWNDSHRNILDNR